MYYHSVSFISICTVKGGASLMTSKRKIKKQNLTIKDLITIGIFSAIIFVCISLSGGPFAMFPALTFYFPVGASLLAGPVYLLLIAKVPKTGPIFIAGLLMAIFCYATGMHIGMTIGYLVGSAAADLLAWTAHYKSIRINILSYIVFCLGGTGSYIAYFINPEAWVSRMLEKGTPKEYLDTMTSAVNHRIFLTMLAGTVFVALLSGFVGSKLLKKHFAKAGITV